MWILAAMRDDEIVLIAIAIIVLIIGVPMGIIVICKIINAIFQIIGEIGGEISSNLRIPSFYLKKLFLLFGRILYLPIHFLAEILQLLVPFLGKMLLKVLIYLFDKMPSFVTCVILVPLKILSNELYSILKSLFTSCKQRNADIKKTDLEIFDAIVKAKHKIANQNPEGFQEIKRLIYQYGKSRIHNILKR